jgi:hypothetical protein
MGTPLNHRVKLTLSLDVMRASTLRNMAADARRCRDGYAGPNGSATHWRAWEDAAIAFEQAADKMDEQHVKALDIEPDE